MPICNSSKLYAYSVLIEIESLSIKLFFPFLEYILPLTFVNANGDKVSLSIAGVKPNITKDEVNSLVDTIITKDVFENKGVSLASKYGTQLTQRQTTKFDI